MHKSSDAQMWLDQRKYKSLDPLREVDEYIIMDDCLEMEYDLFVELELERQEIYVTENALVHFWYEKLLKNLGKRILR